MSGTSPREAFAETAAAAQRVAGVIAARHRGDYAGANELLASFDGDEQRAAGALLLADLALALLARAEDRDLGEVSSELSLQLAGIGGGPDGPT